jgi:predicted histidine transporter YuiF (NhaC family)
MDDIMLFVLGLIMGLTISLLFITYSEYRVEKLRLIQQQEKERKEYLSQQLMNKFLNKDEGDDYFA